MNTKTSSPILLAAFLLSALSACGPTVRNGSGLESAKVQTVALLPAKTDPDIRRERVDYLRKSLSRALTTRGYVVLDDNIVAKVCPDVECKNRAQFKDKYGVDTLVELTLKSTNRFNFGAGYYNSIDGTVRLLTPDSKELIAVENTQRERGGLLFNSGQVLQGLIETYENAGDDSYNKLADAFTQTIVLKLPQPAGGAALAKVSDVNITGTEITPLGDSRFQVCIDGNPNATAQFVVDRVKTPLRETAPGKYCNSLLLGGLVQPGSRVMAELRSPFGVPAQQNIDAAPFLSCAPQHLVSRSVLGDNPRLTFGCSDGLSGEDKSKCESQLATCTGSQFLIFRADSTVGPFQKVGQSAQETWVDKKAKTANNPVYAVVAVSKNSGASAPVLPKSN